MPSHVLKVLYRLKSKGYMGLLVGGALRDLLRNREPRDYDVATDAPLDEIRALFRNSKTIGKRFPIVHAYFGNEVVEISSLKGDGDEQGYELVRSDALRRDFTANAVFYNIDGFRVVDPLGAIEHIEDGDVVCIGEPSHKFSEDAVRMLRALKLVAKQGFELGEEMEAAIRSHATGVVDIGPGRKYEEITRIILDKFGLSILSLCKKYGILSHLWPQGASLLQHHGLQYFETLSKETPVSYSRGSFAKHSHTHLWMRLYMDSEYFEFSQDLHFHRKQFETFLAPLAMPFRVPILDAVVLISQMRLDPDRRPEGRFSKEVQKLLQYYLEHMSSDEVPGWWRHQIFPNRRKEHGAQKQGGGRRRRRRRRRGGRGKGKGGPAKPTSQA